MSPVGKGEYSCCATDIHFDDIENHYGRDGIEPVDLKSLQRLETSLCSRGANERPSAIASVQNPYPAVPKPRPTIWRLRHAKLEYPLPPSLIDGNAPGRGVSLNVCENLLDGARDDAPILS